MSRARSVELARQFRREPTGCEARLWACLRDRKFLGLKFRRQHPRPGCIADFYCAEKGLVVEVDGGVHRDGERAERDRVRDEELERNGVTTLRFRNDEVEGSLEAVLQRLAKWVESR